MWLKRLVTYTLIFFAIVLTGFIMTWLMDI